MTCKHETEHLMGTAEGIVCTACGATFKEWDDVIKARGEKPVEAQEKPKKTRAKITIKVLYIHFFISSTPFYIF